MAGVIVEGEVGRERVVGYFMPWIPGRAIAEKAPEEIAACRALFLEIDRTLVAWGWYWQDPKLSNFVFDERHSRLRAVDLKQIRRLHSPVFDPDRMEGSPRRRKLEALQLSPGDYDDMAQRRRESWSALRGLPVDPATAAGAG
jgi:hypothetical protein